MSGERQEDVRSGSARLLVHHILLVFALGIAACTTTPKRNVPVQPASSLSSFEAKGRIAVSGPGGGGSGSFVWMQQGPDAHVALRGPVGVGSLKLTVGDTSLRIETGDGQVFDAEDAQAELKQRLGATVPTDKLRYWLVGIPAPGEHEWSNAGETPTLLQDSWKIDYQRFDTASGVRLPMKLSAASGQARVRIVIDRWQIK